MENDDLASIVIVTVILLGIFINVRNINHGLTERDKINANKEIILECINVYSMEECLKLKHP